VVVSRDVRFEEGRAFRRSLESRDSIEEVSETQIDVLEGAQPQHQFQGDRVTLHSFRFIVAEGLGRGCRDFRISECWYEI
jgi:hypothetical protein